MLNAQSPVSTGLRTCTTTLARLLRETAMAYLQFPYQALGTRPPDPTLALAPGRGRKAPDSLPGTITGRHLPLDRCSSDRRQEGLLGGLAAPRQC